MGSLLKSYLDIFHDSHTLRILYEMGVLFQSILPGLLIGLAVSSFLVAWWPVHYLKKHYSVDRLPAIIVMAFLGTLSPFCSYLAIPIAASLIMAGISPAPVIAFLCSTPLMNPALFAMTWSTFGLPMASARALSAIAFGVIGGILAIKFSDKILVFVQSARNKSKKDPLERSEDSPFSQRWWNSFIHLGWFVLKYVTLGICIAAIVKELIPMEWIMTAVGRQHGYSILLGALLGVPLYACGGGTIPIIQVLMDMGMAPGAALAFFIAGPATKIPTLAAMNLTMGVIMTVFYFLLSLSWSIIAGFLFQVMF